MISRVIDPSAVFTVPELKELFGLKDGSIPREIRKGRLKAHKVCGRYWIIGKDVLKWIEGQRAAEQFAGEPQVYDLTPQAGRATA